MAVKCGFKLKVKTENGVTFPAVDGKEVDSILYDQLQDALPKGKEAETLYTKVIAYSGKFIELYGDPYKGPYDLEKNPKGYTLETDKNGEPLLEDALNFYRIDRLMRQPQNLGKETVLTKKMAALQKSINSIEKQLGAFRRNRETERLTGELEALRDRLLKDLQDGEEEAGLIRYAQNALKYTKENLKNLEELEANRLKPEIPIDKRLTARKLQNIYEYIKAFTNIDELIISGKEGYIPLDKETLDTLKETAGVRNIIEERYKKISIEFIKQQFAPSNEESEVLYRLKLRNKYIKENPLDPKKENDTEFQKRVKDFLDEEIKKAEESGLLAEMSKTMLEEQLGSVKHDIDLIERWMINASETNDFLLRTMAYEVNAQSDRARLDFQKKAAELHTLWENLVAYQKKRGVKVRDPLKLYDLILEKDKDGNPTRQLTSQYLSSFYDEYNRVSKEARNITAEEGKTAGDKHWDDWAKANVRLNPAISRENRRLYRLLYKRGEASGDKSHWRVHKRNLESQLDRLGLRLHVPKPKIASKYANPQWAELMKLGKDDPQNPVYKFYMAALEYKRISDSRVPGQYRLGYKLGGIRKTFWEKWQAVESFRDVWYKVIKPTIKETFTITEEDIEFGDVDEKIIEAKGKKIEMVSVNADMQERQYIPLHFRGDPGEAQSYELMNSILYTYYTAANYHYLNNLLPYIEMIKYHVKQRNVTKSKGFKELGASGLTGEVRLTEKGEYTNAYDAMQDFIEQRVYGVTKVDPGIELFGVNFMKLVNFWMTYLGLVVLGGNYLSAKANWNLAQALTWIEGMGGEFYSAKNVANGEKKYAMDLLNIFGDVGAIRPTSKTGLLDELFDPLNDFNVRQYNYADKSRIERLANTSAGHFLNNMAEHNVQNLTMYAFLDAIKVMNSKGEYLSRGGGTTKERSKAMSLDEAYTLENNALVLNPEVKHINSETFGTLKYYEERLEPINPEDAVEVTDYKLRADIKITNAIQQINRDLHGAYSIRNMPPFQRLWVGALALMLRKFLPPAVQRRFSGGLAYIHNRFQQKDPDYHEDTKRFRVGTKTLSEGAYITALRVLPKLLKAIVLDLTKMQRDLQRTEWSTLDRNEKANVIRTVGELGLGITMFAFGAVLRGMAEDDDDNRYLYYLSFQTNRLYTELFAYLSPTEMMRILQSPMATITMIERLKNFVSQLAEDVIWNMGDFEKYESGSRKGTYKLQKQFTDLIPFWKHGTRHKYLEDIVNYYYK